MEISESRALVPVRSKQTAVQTILRKRRSAGNGGAGTGRWGDEEQRKADRQFIRDSMRQMNQWRKARNATTAKPGAARLTTGALTRRDLRRSFALGAASAIGGGGMMMLAIAIIASSLGWSGP
ncbi:hypothetical protein, partial [Acidiphilium sp.]|uniref:hypothetical protein n=1 Tax=Acidiphilium sp. TaxID=527 RepID=UPI003D0754C7